MAQELRTLFETRRDLAVIEERSRLARELHDSAKQQAFAANAQLGAARALIDHDPKSAESRIEEAENLIHNLGKELTAVIAELRPVALESDGLTSAIRRLAADWSRQNRIPLDVRIQGEHPLPLETEQAVLRIVQETLANIARHSKAETASVELTFNGNELRCTVTDDGVGFDMNESFYGYGLRSMRERTALHGGSLSVVSEIGKGTQITAIVTTGNSRLVEVPTDG
jgi:NarL family two-component system sensor histidine kinase LiaS